MDENKGSESDKDDSIEQGSKIKPKIRSRKRKRNNSNSSTDLDDVLPENTLEIEKSLHASAIKNNLDDISVKKILKKGVPLTKNEVLFLVQLVRANKIVTDKTTNATNNRLKEEAWSTISDQFNASVSSCSRRPEQLRLKWENLKKAARKRNSNISINQFKAGKAEYIPPDEVLDQVASILGSAGDGFSVPFGEEGSEPLVCLPSIAFGSVTDGSSTDNMIQLETSITPKRKLLFGSVSKNAARKKKMYDAVTSSQIERNIAVAQYYDKKRSLLDANITKKVVTNDHVLALVKLREEEDSGNEEGLRPKLTRSKVKELLKVSPSSASWNAIELSPINHIPVKTRPEVKALIAQELPDDEDDDEYKPHHDESDDDHATESCSDLESQPRTPATPHKQTSNIDIVQDGPFKVPPNVATKTQKKLNQEEATIALRTRSKLSLSSTPIEHIESSFIPPDDLPMPAVDDLWNNFLEECLNPVSNTRHEEDDEADPEYNVAADPDANEEDEEALDNSIVKISRKELNDLVTELFSVLPQGVEEQLVSGMGLLGEGVGVLGEGAGVLGEGAGVLGEVAGVLGEGAGVLGEGAGVLGEGAGVLGEGAGVLGEVAGVLGEGAGVLGEAAGDMVKPPWEGKQEPMSDEEMNVPIACKVERRDSISIGKMEPEDDDEIDTENVLSASVETQTLHTSGCSVPSTPGPSTVQISVVEHSACVLEPASPRRQPAALRQLLQSNQPPATVHVTVARDMQMYSEQVLILEQQLRQHIQLATTYFLQLFVHPVHWSYAPKYKDYLESLEQLTLLNPKSVANVCNLKPALELVKGWEESVSENTPENVEMVEFIQKEVEKSRKRISQNSMYLGDFPELFKRVVANSSVFLYPYLLPPSPCRADFSTKRYGYFISEDELIVLGLKQFSEYVEANPLLFKRPRVHPRKRWSLTTATELTCNYMFPWISVRCLLGHLHMAKRSGDRANPIVKYFENNIIEPVKHKLLPFNPSLTLYEHPEFEMPKIWIKYLAKSSKRFKDSLSRKSHVSIKPSGVDITTHILEPQQKKPLPIDFVKPILCDRNNILLKPKPDLVNKLDVHITTQSPVYIAANLYTLVQTSSGAQLLPLQVNTSTVNSASTPICTPILLNSVPKATPTVTGDVIEIKDDTDEKKKPKNKDHCICCDLLRKICKTRQSLITEFFKSNTKVSRSCGCRNRKYPNITNKLRLLVNNYKATSLTAHCNLINRIRACKPGHDKKEEDNLIFNDREFVDAMKFQIKLMQRTIIAKNNKLKLRVNNAFSNFDCEDGNPLELIDRLYKIFDIELADMYTELLTFLSPLQADQINRFKEYFTRNCLQDLMLKIDEHVKDNSIRSGLLSQIQSDIYKNLPACELCHRLLEHMKNYPELARYTFDLFPHLWREESNIEERSQQKVRNVTLVTSKGNVNNQKDVKLVPQSIPSQHNEPVVTCDETAETIDYEADGSSSSEEEADVTLIENNTNNHTENGEDLKLVTTVEYEIETPELSVSKTDVQENSSDMSLLVMSDDDSVKSEPTDWKRDEDKIILEVLKQFLTPEQINDKTIIEVIEENLLAMIAENLSDKSLDDVRERVLYLLQVLGNDT